MSSVYTYTHVGKRELEFAFIRQLAGPAPVGIHALYCTRAAESIPSIFESAPGRHLRASPFSEGDPLAYFSRRASDEDYVSFQDQQTLYLRWTGDSEDFLGFDRRFAEWCEEHPRSSLLPVTTVEERPSESGWLSSRTNELNGRD